MMSAPTLSDIMIAELKLRERLSEEVRLVRLQAAAVAVMAEMQELGWSAEAAAPLARVWTMSRERLKAIEAEPLEFVWLAPAGAKA